MQSTDDVIVNNKTPRLPRWTRQEILVLIQGKRVTESKVRTNRAGLGPTEPKWVSVSSYCKRHGVNRGPIQCRKRWSNLSGDYKKIKEWENSRIKDEISSESFWVMRNDLRRERKLPGFFDKEVFDILDGGEMKSVGVEGLELALVTGEEETVLFDSGRSAAEDGLLFSDNEEEEGGSKDGGDDSNSIPDAVPVSVSVAAEKQYESPPKESPVRGTTHEKQPIPETEIGNTQERRKRKRHASTSGEEGETTNLEHALLEALEKNGQMLRSQLEAQNTNLQLDREQRKEHADSLISVLNKLADTLGRVADKL